MNQHDQWFDGMARSLIRYAAYQAPPALMERLKEEWLADLTSRSGALSQLRFAFGCCWATTVITHEFRAPARAVVAAAANKTTGERTITTYAYHPTSLLSPQITLASGDSDLCEINTTPLIDVMLVLLVTLIISLPIMTHAVKLDLPRTPPSQDQPRPEVIDLDIDFDGTVAWNGTPVASTQQLEGYFRAEAQKDPQPEIHLRADRRVKYDFVAKVLASAQHNRMERLGFVDTAEFKD
jgi:biopolymer transport protein ExbD